MSLDLYIKSKRPVRHRGTGVFVRDNGTTKELLTIEEVRAHFPNTDISHIEVIEYETDYVWHGNVTHNLNTMAKHVPIGAHTLYDYLWRPDEMGITKVTEEYVDAIRLSFNYLKIHERELIEYNSTNGWGTYDNLFDFCQSLLACLANLNYNGEGYELEASR